VLITHDLGVVAEIADRVVVMNKGVIVETGTPREVYHAPKHPYTQRLISAAPGKGEIKLLDETSPVLLRVEKLQKTYGNFDALKDVSFNLTRGQSLAVVGESGSGKSTLARTLLRLEDADSGHEIGRAH